MVRCGAHLSNLALGSSKMALRLFGTKAVQEAFESFRPSNRRQTLKARATDANVNVCRMEIALLGLK
jgi:hypothetical protein